MIICSQIYKTKGCGFGDPEENFTASGFPGGSAGKESACNVGDVGSIPGSGRFPGEGNSFLLQTLQKVGPLRGKLRDWKEDLLLL